MSSDDYWQQRENAIFREEMERLQKLAAENALIRDRKIGGELALRPSNEMIERDLGPQLDHQKMAQEAAQRTDERMQAERAALEHQREVQRSMDEHNRRIEQEKQQDRQRENSAREIMRQKMSRTRGRSR